MTEFDSLISKIWQENETEQNSFLEAIAIGIRNNMPLEILKKRQMVYVPNDEYLIHFFGDKIKHFSYGLYDRSGRCKVYKRLLIPIRNFKDEIVSFAAYSNGNDEKENPAFRKYLFLSNDVWSKKRYIYISKEDYVRALEKGYLIIVDGLFDAEMLNHYGFPAASLMGSYISEYAKVYLKFIPKIIVGKDSDSAGERLADKMRKYRKDSISLFQGEEKDLDDFLKSEDNLKLFLEAMIKAEKSGFVFGIDVA